MTVLLIGLGLLWGLVLVRASVYAAEDPYTSHRGRV